MSRAFEVLDLVSAVPSGRTATDIAEALHVPVPTAHHLLNTLVDAGALSKHERRYMLGPKMAIFGEALFRSNYVPVHLLPIMERLADETRESIYLSAWRRGEIVVLYVIEGSHTINAAGPRVGFSGHAHARASGKVLLASLDAEALELYLRSHPLEPTTTATITDIEQLQHELEAVRRKGYAVDREEFMDGVACIAASIAVGPTTFGAITLSAPAARLRERLEAYVAAVVTAARVAGHHSADDGSRPEAVTF